LDFAKKAIFGNLPGNARIGNYNWFLVILSLQYHQKHGPSSPEKNHSLSSPEKTMVCHPWKKNGPSMRPAFY
jgi:hypothetical protein